MQTPKDQVQAYEFMMERMATALVVGDPSNMNLPTKRGRSGMIFGTAAALLIAIGFFVYGLFVPAGNTVWKQKGAILVEKESGSRYVLVNGQLMPTPNQASAMLVQGGGSTIHVIKRKSLAGLPRGPQIGINGAPDTVPRQNELLPAHWLLCPALTSGGLPSMSVTLDASGVGEAPGDRYAPVRSSGGELYVIWNNAKHRVPDTSSMIALGLASTRTPVVPRQWLSQLRDGPALVAADVPDAGTAGLTVAGRQRQIGDLFFHEPGNGTRQRYVLLQQGLAPVSATEYELMAARSDKSPVEIDARSIVTAPVSTDHTFLQRVPDLTGLQPLSEHAGSVCLAQVAAGTEVVTAAVIVRGAEHWQPVTQSGAIVPPNRGLLVTEVPVREGQKPPNVYLISDRGKRYLIPDGDAMQALGLAGANTASMHTQVLSMIPAGPVLSRSAVVIEQGG